MKRGQKKVLIVDPDLPFAGRLTSLLSSKGYDVTAVTGLREAAQMIKDVSFGCVIMDEDLPEIKGYDAIPIIRALDPDIPVIMTTTHNAPELESKIRAREIFFYHCKAFSMQELRIAVASAFKRGRKGEAGMKGMRR